MKKIVEVAMLAGAALALSACGGQEAEAPAAEPAAEEEMMVEETPAAVSAEAPVADATAASDDVDPTSNPIGP